MTYLLRKLRSLCSERGRAREGKILGERMPSWRRANSAMNHHHLHYSAVQKVPKAFLMTGPFMEENRPQLASNRCPKPQEFTYPDSITLGEKSIDVGPEIDL